MVLEGFTAYVRNLPVPEEWRDSQNVVRSKDIQIKIGLKFPEYGIFLLSNSEVQFFPKYINVFPDVF
jgi:hypothetical protein